MDRRGVHGDASLKLGWLRCCEALWLYSFESELVNSERPNLNSSGVTPHHCIINLQYPETLVGEMSNASSGIFKTLPEYARESLVLHFADRNTEKHTLISKVVIS